MYEFTIYQEFPPKVQSSALKIRPARAPVVVTKTVCSPPTHGPTRNNSAQRGRDWSQGSRDGERRGPHGLCAEFASTDAGASSLNRLVVFVLLRRCALALRPPCPFSLPLCVSHLGNGASRRAASFPASLRHGILCAQQLSPTEPLRAQHDFS